MHYNTNTKNYSHVKFPFSTCDSSSLRFSKIQIGFTFVVPAHPGSPRQKAIKCVCVSERQAESGVKASEHGD